METPKTNLNMENKQKLLPQIPSLACEKCFEKITVLNYTIYKTISKQVLNVPKKLYYPNILLSDGKLTCITQCFCEEFPKKHTDAIKEKFDEQSVIHMETDPEDLTTTEKTVKTEETSIVDFCTNDYSCMCEACQNKYGSLPLLLQGIEQKSLAEKDNGEPQPSTSTSDISSSSLTSKRSLVCQYCSKSFNHKGDFNKHLRKHTREQPYSCSVCDRKFAHTSNLQRHLRLHSGQKPYTCQNCHKSFSRKDKLESHKRSKLCQASVNFNIE